MENESVAPAPSSFGALLRRYRSAAGLSQEALAERARVSSQGIGALERGDRRTPQRETLLLLIAALGLDDERRAIFEAAASRRETIRRPGRLVLEPAAWSAPTFGTLPHALTSFVGRDAEVVDIAALVREHRLVTLAGPGGIGKTRTALEVAATVDSERGGVRLVEFAALRDASLVGATIASALGLQLSGSRPALETVRLHLLRERVLLVADNCEHVVEEAARVVAELLRACPLLHVLATSREPLRVTGEYTYRLPPLATPGLIDVPALDTTTAAGYAAVELFTQRARAAHQHFALTHATVAAVGEICGSTAFRWRSNSPQPVSRPGRYRRSQIRCGAGSPCSRMAAARLRRVTKPCTRRSNGATIYWARKNATSSKRSRSSPAAGRSRYC